MICSSCQHENPETARFCNACGAQLETQCAQCDHTNPPGSRFCNHCGAPLGPQSVPTSPAPTPPLRPPASYTPQHLAERIRAEQAAIESRGAADGERKTITALFADLKGSTALIEGLDPEDARAIIDPALQLMMDAVHRYDGYVAQALGDGIFALFGAPLAHEDHPQRALYAALRMQEEMRQYSDQIRLKHGVPLHMRVGINTGEVVVRSIRKDDLHADYVPVGHSTNLAARMEQMATPGSIVISEYTQKLTEGYFELKALGAADIKGVEAPLNVYEVLGAGPLRTRLQVAARRGLSRFVGRHSELDQMLRALEQAQAGHGQIVGVMGEPGLGKSRLFYEFKLTSQRGCLMLEAFPVSHGKASPYLPIIELLKNYFAIVPEDDERRQGEKVTGKVLALDRSLEDTLPYLFSLISIDDPQSSLQQMDAQIRRRRTFEALKKLFLRESLNQPLILIFEDLHWIDSETQGFLDTLSESVASAKVLLLVNYRPEYRHEWGSKTYYSQLRLTPLGKAEAEELLTFLLGNDASLGHIKLLILERTEGTPFFMEEVVQTLAEEGVLVGERGNYRLETTQTELHISPTVQGVLAARIDRLTAEEKELLQQLSVIGRQFPLGLVQKVVSHAEDELSRLFASLQAKEFLYEQPTFPEVEYVFKHALTQEVAYSTVLQDRRRVWHEQTARAIEALYVSNLDEHYGALADHYGRSGNAAQAAKYLEAAGEQAERHSDNTQAIAHFSAALEQLKTLPDNAGRRQRELSVQVALGPALMSTKGYAAPEVEQAYDRAYELCRQGENTTQATRIQLGRALLHYLRAEYEAAFAISRQIINAAHEETALTLNARVLIAEGAYWLGDPVTARRGQEEIIALYDASRHAPGILVTDDPLVMLLSGLGMALWALGYPDAGLASVERALSAAERTGHAMSRAFAGSVICRVHYLRKEPAATRRRAEELIALCEDRGIPLRQAMGTIHHGWARVHEGNAEAGIEEIEQGVAAWRATGAKAFVSMWMLPLIEACGQARRLQDGLRAIAEAGEIVAHTKEKIAEAELYRLKGELLLNDERGMMNAEWRTRKTESLHHAAEAEVCFHKAIEIARRQEAKSWELRAATSLAHLWQQQGKRAEARELLAPVYDWFTEGFDTADLKDAKALLAELSEGV